MSDESSEDDSVYSTTNVLLGYASKEPTGDEVSYLGGKPSWLGDMKPSYDLVQCNICQNPIAQLLQLNGELPEYFPTHDRRLHILACRRKACSRKPGSVKVLRATRHSIEIDVTKKTHQEKLPKQPYATLGNDIFGVKPTLSAGANPFSKASPPLTVGAKDSVSSEAPRSSYSSAAQTNHITRAPKASKPWPSDGVQSNDYPKLYLDAEYESLNEPKNSEPSSAGQISTLEDESGQVDSASSAAKDDSEVFESEIDKTFQKFADRLSQNPEQVLRYEFKGSPLLYSTKDDIGKIFNPAVPSKAVSTNKGLPRCANCGQSRVFELQITPHAIIELEGDDLGLDGMEWGTIIAGVCSADCQANSISPGDVGYIEEWVGVQWEEIKR